MQLVREGPAWREGAEAEVAVPAEEAGVRSWAAPAVKAADSVFGPSELALALVVVVVVLGAEKGPESMRSAGKAARILMV
ncbi:hypothetical protein GCM10010279_42600 [Streptomyces mutabilis]|nr:twin-arginine translocase TatA/TatE family subunit [Streptomyces mutabilis]GGQ29981.1 hypothetical protein GCM10010279_42600 [Streptomyces mutabilis]